MLENVSASRTRLGVEIPRTYTVGGNTHRAARNTKKIVKDAGFPREKYTGCRHADISRLVIKSRGRAGAARAWIAAERLGETVIALVSAGRKAAMHGKWKSVIP